MLGLCDRCNDGIPINIYIVMTTMYMKPTRSLENTYGLMQLITQFWCIALDKTLLFSLFFVSVNPIQAPWDWFIRPDSMCVYTWYECISMGIQKKSTHDMESLLLTCVNFESAIVLCIYGVLAEPKGRNCVGGQCFHANTLLVATHYAHANTQRTCATVKRLDTIRFLILVDECLTLHHSSTLPYIPP